MKLYVTVAYAECWGLSLTPTLPSCRGLDRIQKPSGQYPVSAHAEKTHVVLRCCQHPTLLVLSVSTVIASYYSGTYSANLCFYPMCLGPGQCLITVVLGTRLDHSIAPRTVAISLNSSTDPGQLPVPLHSSLLYYTVSPTPRLLTTWASWAS